MSKKGLFTGLLALLLVFALLGCEQVTSGTKPGSGPGTGASPDDKWTEVTSLDGLDGTWKSRYKMTTTVLTDPNAAITVLEEYTYPVSNGNIKDGVEKIYIQDYTDIIKKVASAGLSEKVAWDSIKSGLGDSYEFSEVAPYTAKRTEYIAREDFEGEYIDDNSSISVNQNKTRMKVTDKWWRSGIQDDAEWEDFKASQPVYSGDMSVVYAKESVEDDTIPYTCTYITILHKQ